MSERRHFPLVTLVAFTAVSIMTVIAILVVNDIREDRRQTLVTVGPLQVYEDNDFWAKGKPTALVEPHARLSVRRIRYGKDYMAVKVRLEGGREGWAFSGEPFVLR